MNKERTELFFELLTIVKKCFEIVFGFVVKDEAFAVGDKLVELDGKDEFLPCFHVPVGEGGRRGHAVKSSINFNSLKMFGVIG